MYCITALAFDWLTEKAPYPACQWNCSTAGPLVLIHLDELVFTVSATCATVLVRDRPNNR
jgi:hypothetical protein